MAAPTRCLALRSAVRQTEGPRLLPSAVWSTAAAQLLAPPTVPGWAAWVFFQAGETSGCVSPYETGEARVLGPCRALVGSQVSGSRSRKRWCLRGGPPWVPGQRSALPRSGRCRFRLHFVPCTVPVR